MKGKFFESIKLENGRLQLLPYHEKRMQNTRSFFYGIEAAIDLNSEIEIPQTFQNGLYKCRVSYDKKIRKIEFLPYQFSEISSVLLLEIGSVNHYEFKFENRTFFQKALAENPEVDDVLFLSDACLTDCTYSNVLLFDGSTWFTPKTKLLNGAKRQYLIDNELVIEKTITKKELTKYSKIAFANALRDFEIVYDFEEHENKLHLKKIPFPT